MTERNLRRPFMLNDKDPFGFADAINIDHLTNEQVEELLKMFDE